MSRTTFRNASGLPDPGPGHHRPRHGDASGAPCRIASRSTSRISRRRASSIRAARSPTTIASSAVWRASTASRPDIRGPPATISSPRSIATATTARCRGPGRQDRLVARPADGRRICHRLTDARRRLPDRGPLSLIVPDGTSDSMTDIALADAAPTEANSAAVASLVAEDERSQRSTSATTTRLPPFRLPGSLGDDRAAAADRAGRSSLPQRRPKPPRRPCSTVPGTKPPSFSPRRLRSRSRCVKNSVTLYRARFAGFATKQAARDACDALTKQKFTCLALSN